MLEAKDAYRATYVPLSRNDIIEITSVAKGKQQAARTEKIKKVLASGQYASTTSKVESKIDMLHVEVYDIRKNLTSEHPIAYIPEMLGMSRLVKARIEAHKDKDAKALVLKPVLEGCDSGSKDAGLTSICFITNL